MITQVRAARPAIILGGQDYYSSLAPYRVSMSYTDNCDGKKGDDLSIELADREGKFISSWMPKKGVTLEASIIAERWFAPNAASISLDCGEFWIDSVEFELPDHKVSVKATSIPTDQRIKAGKETRGWEKTSLKDIATQITGENNMSLDWQADINPRYKRTEMHEESGLGFLMKRCNDAKLSIKVHRNKIVVFDEQKMEAAEPAFSLLYGNTAVALGMTCYRMAGGHFSTKVVDTLKKARVSKSDPETGETSTEEATSDDDDLEDNTEENHNTDTDTDSDQGGGDTLLIIAPRADPGQDNWNMSSADAGGQLKAKSIVREKNKEKDKAKVELSIGNPLIAAGMTFNLVGCGQFDGKWFIESAHHTVGPEYKTELDIRRCLTGL
jgi:phage protein D